jgi:hypothetical protein
VSYSHYEGTEKVLLPHETHFTKEEFDNIVANCYVAVYMEEKEKDSDITFEEIFMRIEDKFKKLFENCKDIRDFKDNLYMFLLGYLGCDIYAIIFKEQIYIGIPDSFSIASVYKYTDIVSEIMCKEVVVYQGKFYELCRDKTYSDVINFLNKKLGLINKVCVWCKGKENIVRVGCSEDYQYFDNYQIKHYKYCPYCGGEINMEVE